MRRRAALAVAVLAAFAVLGLASIAGAEGPKLLGSVGPGFVISLKDAAGNRVTNLQAGPYELEIDDLGEEHDFHITGPGVDESTDVSFTGKKTVQLSLLDGTYKFFCDPHALSMRGTLTVGAGSPSSGGSGSGGGTTTKPAATKLVLTVGPAFTISLKTAAGKVVKSLGPGAYSIEVRDRAGIHNAHILGAGVNRKTGVPFKGTQTWNVTLKQGTLTFQCDPHKSSMRGTVKIA